MDEKRDLLDERWKDEKESYQLFGLVFTWLIGPVVVGRVEGGTGR